MSPVDQQVLSLIMDYYTHFNRFPAQVEVEQDLLQFATRKEFAFRIDGHCLFLLSADFHDGYPVITIPVIELPGEVYEPSMQELRGQA